jgi:hypothetical protein
VLLPPASNPSVNSVAAPDLPATNANEKTVAEATTAKKTNKRLPLTKNPPNRGTTGLQVLNKLLQLC